MEDRAVDEDVADGSEHSQGEIQWPECPDPRCSSADHSELLLEWEAYTGPGEFDYGLEAGYKKVVKKSGKKEVVTGLTKYTLACSEYFPDGKVPCCMNGRSLVQDCESLHWTSVYVGNQNTCRVEDLLPGMGYIFRLLVLPKLSPAVTPATSNEVLFFTPPSPPGTPEAPALVDRARTSLKLKWQPPMVTGGMPITEYHVEMKGKADDSFEKIYAGTSLSSKVTRLVPGASYVFRIKVANSLGTSNFSEQAEYNTAPSVPAAPSSPTLYSSTSDSLTVHWEEPQNHGLPINSYTLEVDDGSDGAFTSAYVGMNRRCEVGNLKSGCTYTFRVLAQNDVGKGAFSLPARISTASSHPSAPHSVSFHSRTTESAIVSWSAPDHDGGSCISGYELEFTVKGCHMDWNQVSVGQSNTYTLLGLRPGRQYKVRVRANNAEGPGNFSPEAGFGTLPGPPEPPPPPEIVELHPTSLKVCWAEPCHNGGSTILSYHLELRGNDAEEHVCVYKGLDMSTVVDDLNPGHTYAFRIQAVNKAGPSAWSGSSEAETKPAKPDIPEPPVFPNASSTSLSLRWSTPNPNGSSVLSFHLCMAILSYGVHEQSETLRQCSSDDSQFVSDEHECIDPGFVLVYSGPAAGYTVKNLQPFTTYAFRLQACNAVGASGYSQVVSRTTFPSTPEPPAAPLVIESSRHDILLQWEFPERDNGAKVTAFCLEMRSGDPLTNNSKRRKPQTETFDWSELYQGPLLSHKVSGLLPGLPYVFRLKAFNEHGASRPSILTAHTLSAEPSPPQPPTFTGLSPTSVRVRWSAPSCDNGSLVLRYKLLMDSIEPGTMQKVYEGESTSYKASKLTPGRIYKAAVQAINSVGASEMSDLASVTLPPMSLPTLAAPRLELDSKNVLAISWVKTDHADVRSYTLQMESASGKIAEVYEGLDPRYSISAPHSCKFRVKANGTSVSGPWSPFSTWIPPPLAPGKTSQQRSSPSFATREVLLKSVRRGFTEPWSLYTRLLLLSGGIILCLTCSYIYHF